MFRDATRSVQLVAAAMASAEFDAPKLEAHAGDGWTTLTELADTLVRDHGLPFKTAHAIAAHLVGGRQRHPDRAILRAADRRLDGDSRQAAELLRGAVTHILSPRHFVEVRTTFGGPAPEETARAAKVSRAAARRRRGMVDLRHRCAREGGADTRRPERGLCERTRTELEPERTSNPER